MVFAETVTYVVCRCQLTKLLFNELTVLLDYIDLFNLSGNIKIFGRSYPALYNSFFILSIAIVANKVYFIPICFYIPAFCSLLLPSNFSKSYFSKIDASLSRWIIMLAQN